MSHPPAEIIEIFSAIQGEGPILGRRQIFLRFGRCDVTCSYCDTPLCHVELPAARIERTPGRRDFVRVANPIGLEALIEAVIRLDEPRGLHHSVSLTGGEPLLHAEAIAAIAPALRARGLRLYLETSGHLVAELDRVLDLVDIVGMDIKIASATGFPARHDDNRRFLARCRDAGREVFCKVVIGEDVTDAELDAALAVVAEVAPETPFVIQPLTPFAGRGRPPAPERLIELDERARRRLPQVLVIPQTHKMINQL
ncbi:MAG: 7-carboxy-7-deazaguanine synthase QueE [Planctomycetes bacterium]|nr:7-carboxy-7-deazaguanine synthase QueE [Planctomycetota bacterium]